MTRRPKPPEDDPPPTWQSNLTDPDSALMRRSDAHEYRQAHNAQAVVCAEPRSGAADRTLLQRAAGRPLSSTGDAKSRGW